MSCVHSCPEGKCPRASTLPCGDGGRGSSMNTHPASFHGLGRVGISHTLLRPWQLIQPDSVDPMASVTSYLRTMQRFISTQPSDPTLALTKLLTAPGPPNLFTIKRKISGLGSPKCLMTFKVLLSVLLRVSLWVSFR